MRRVVGTVLTAMLLLAGCGDDEETATTGSSAPTTVVSGQTPTGGGSGLPPGHGHEGATGTCSATAAQPVVVAQGNAFDKTCVAVAANRAFTISFENKDTAAHGFTIAESETATTNLFQQAPVRGPQTVAMNVGPLRPGTFFFKCQVHPAQMKGTFVVT
jgi:plastocyanin